MRPPCKDCPDRWAECHANCEKWAEYEEARREYYKQKTAKDKVEIILRQIEFDRISAKRKSKGGRL